MASATSSPIFKQVKQRSLVLWLLGFTVVYQMVYQIFVWRTLEMEEAASSDEWCASVVGPHGVATSPSSTRCLEAQLFRSWQQAAAGAARFKEEDRLNSIEDMNSSWNVSVVPPVASLSSRAVLPTTTGARLSAYEATEVAEASPSAAAADASTAALPPTDQQGAVQSTTWSPMTAWAQGLEDLQKRMEARIWALPSTQRKRREELFQNLDRIADNITASLARGGNNTYWDQELAQLQERVEAHKARQRARRAASKEVQHQQQKKKEESLLSQITAYHREICQEPFRVNYTSCRGFLPARSAATNDTEELIRRTAALDSDLAAIAAESSTWQKSFEDRVAQTRKELCEEPWRRDRPDCAEFLADMKAQERQKAETLRAERRARRAELRANITRETKEKTAALDAELSELASQHRVWENELLEKYGLAHVAASNGTKAAEAEVAGAVVEDQAEAAKPQGPRELHWSTVAAWASGSTRTRQLRGSSGNRDGSVVSVVGRHELRRSHWAGMIPKVACVTAIRSGAVAKIQLKYFIENFRLQTYEGPMQLVLVYHYTDHAAARLVAGYADGFYIKGVAARGESDFPSTTSFRFGAWSSDADVIVHWKFSEWQHPQRLSLQVRALAYSSRPACVLRSPKVQEQEQDRRQVGVETEGEHEEGSREEEAQDEPWDETLAGEAAWMREHWHPFLKEQRAVLLGAEAHHLVEVDMYKSALA